MSSMFVEHRADSVFNRRTRTLRMAGIELPAECVEIAQRLSAFESSTNGTPCRDQLVAAIASGDTDLATLTALALAEANPGRPDVFDAVRAEINAKVREAYRPHAAGIYCQVADLFDSAAAAFIKSAGAFDPEASPDAAIEATAADQKAWKSAAAHAAELDRLTGPLLVAALLAEIPGGSDNPAVHAGSFQDRIAEKDLTLALCVDPSGHDRQRVWDAWDAVELQSQAASRAAQGYTVDAGRPRRCGRWSALWQAGITIKAADLDSYQPFGRTEPVALPTNDPLTEPADKAPQPRSTGHITFASGKSIPV